MTARTMSLNVNAERLSTNSGYSTCAAVNKDVVIRILKDYEAATVFLPKCTRYRYAMGIKSM
ncbi:hypothetical protein [Dickeya zeae]|uniref:hypothetical protein n=1 Tax=Dickeya zeae TaxID=204042 RepID=UPI0003C7DE77|nr:hypothetical protein [Dickeya zeae]PXW48193.1 hypothetical protein DFO54_102284 [Erwinia sp. AG740]AUQ25749.1 hypothetical protein C1O30_11985 [Dickeya zeae]MCA6987081.1 hypothetical protein [Dickeya zeae]UJR58818.1 hypothetical protein HJ580_11885 [Dickeya zeae]UPT55794.1 hypothetical protein FGI00_09670 [Dickeya zeae]